MNVSRVAAAGSILCVVLASCGGDSSKRRVPTTATTRSTGGTGSTSSGNSPANAPSSPNGTSTTGPSSPPPAPPSKEVSPGVVSSSAAGVSATMHAGTHSPGVNKPWPVSFTVTRNGEANVRHLEAEVRYQYLFAGQVVARRSHYRFTGRFNDVFRWPASAVGYPLTFRAVISAAGVTLNLDYAVQVKR